MRGPGRRRSLNLLKNIHIFHDLLDDDLDKLQRIAREDVYGQSVVLFREGDPSSAFYIIKYGRVKIVKAHGTPNAKVLAVLRDGDFFGEMGVIEDSPRYASAIVEDESSILQVRKSDFDEVMSLNPSIAMKIMVTVTRRYKANLEGGGVAEGPVPTPVPAPRPAQPGKIIVFHSSTGGAGVSTLVCNLALALKQRTGKRVLLIDGSTQFGDLSVLLDVIPKQTCYQMAEEADFNFEIINTGYINSTKFGFDFIAAPLKPEQSEVVTADLFRALLGVIKPSYDLILIDTYHLMQEPILTLLESADEVVYVLLPDLPSMKNVRLWLELVKALDFTKAHVNFVLNKLVAESTVNTESIEKNLGLQLAGVIPHDFKLCLECVNKGDLVVNAGAKEPIGKAIMDLSRRLCPDEAVEKGADSFLSGWVGRLTSRLKIGK